jgi:Ca2+:H+ antiporter
VDTDESIPRRDCRRCFFSQNPALDDRFYIEAVRPYCWFAAALLFLSYIIGLWFTLRTHAAVIWNNEADEKKIQDTQPIIPPPRLQRQATQLSTHEAPRTADIRESQLYKRILGQSLKHAGLSQREEVSRRTSSSELAGSNGSVQPPQTPHVVPPKGSRSGSPRAEFRIPGLSEAQNNSLVREVAEIAATAAAIAARDATKNPRKASTNVPQSSQKPTASRAGAVAEEDVIGAESQVASGGGHDAPNWGRTKSAVILCGATVLYALIAEILVNTVDVVLKNVAIDEKFLGITLFALVPNTTEFLVRPSCTSTLFCSDEISRMPFPSP